MTTTRLDAESRVDFKSTQQAFAAYIRDPYNNPAPADVNEPRMAMYRELFFNNIEGFLSANFPVLRKILDDEYWLALTQDFYAKHACLSPYFLQIPAEFLDYLQNERDSAGDLPFMLELAHYEWVEMALSIAQEDGLAGEQDLANLLKLPIAVSPLAWPLAYQYPVHKIAPGFLPLEPPAQPSFLIVYRNSDDDVHFIEITPLTYRLLEIIQQQERPVAQACLQQVAEESKHPDPAIIIAGGLQILQELAGKGIIGVV